MNELVNLVGRDISGWMCSGDNGLIASTLFGNLLKNAVTQNLIQVVIVEEDMLSGISRILESDYRNRGYLPSYAWRYFPAFDGQGTVMKERMSEVLKLCRLDQDKADAVMAYVEFLSDLESELNCEHQMSNERFLWNYVRASSVERFLNAAVLNGNINAEEYEDWITDYTECAEGRMQLKRVLNRLNQCFSLKSERCKSISSLENGERLSFVIKTDMNDEIKDLMFRLIGWDILEAQRSGKQVCLSVIEGDRKFGDELVQLLDVTPSSVNFNLFTKDFFFGHSAEWKQKVEEHVRAHVYTSHSRIESCEEISSKKFGEVPVVRNTYGCDRDRRIANNRVLDQLFNTNRVDHYVQHVPVWEPQYRKEEIHNMPTDVCLVQTDLFEGMINLR